MLGTTGIVPSAVGVGGAGLSSATWKEFILDEIPVAEEDVGDAIRCLLHTVLFTRAPGPVRPSEATCQAFPNITQCWGGALVTGSSYTMGTNNRHLTPYGQPSANNYIDASNIRGANCGYIVIIFFERKVKKALFGLMSNEEKTVFEKWILPVTVTSSPAASQGGNPERELCAGETEAALQNALAHILRAVQNIEHIPIAMYDFEIMTFNSLEEARVSSSYGAGLGNVSVRLMP
ncbi:hypothetical protein PsorP6_019319 [Peronosclerospora sorghi]|nr:hypothetical protein PsorP6_019319 [Peronosclerospora sorghi]